MSLDEGRYAKTIHAHQLVAYLVFAAYLDITIYLSTHPSQTPEEVVNELREEIFRYVGYITMFHLVGVLLTTLFVH